MTYISHILDSKSPLQAVEIAFAELLHRKKKYGSYCENQYLKTILTILEDLRSDEDTIQEIFKCENIEGLK